MANKELRRRIRSIKNTSQITKAMEMVAATKMRRAQSQAISSRPYYSALKKILRSILDNPHTLQHPLLQSNTSTKSIIILLSTDKSLCGALNTNLFRYILNTHSDSSTDFITIGVKGRNFIVRTNRRLLADFPNPDMVEESFVKQVRQLAVEQFLTNQVADVRVVFPDFVSTLTQTPVSSPLLPIDQQKFIDFLSATTDNQPEQNSSTILIEPNLTQVLEYALLHYLDITILSALLETKASEHSARMIAMQNASKNAEELVSDLTLTYNQIRQANITNELLEINSAQTALTT